MMHDQREQLHAALDLVSFKSISPMPNKTHSVKGTKCNSCVMRKAP